MQLAHAWDDGFFALCVKMHSKCRIFTGETVDAFGEFIHVILQEAKKTPKQNRKDRWLNNVKMYFCCTLKSVNIILPCWLALLPLRWLALGHE